MGGCLRLGMRRLCGRDGGLGMREGVGMGILRGLVVVRGEVGGQAASQLCWCTIVWSGWGFKVVCSLLDYAGERVMAGCHLACE